MHDTATPNKRLFAGELSTTFTWYVHGIHHYAINSILYLRTLKEKYVKMYEEFIIQLHMYAKAIRILANIPISCITPSKLQDILNTVQTAIHETNPDYYIVILYIFIYIMI